MRAAVSLCPDVGSFKHEVFEVFVRFQKGGTHIGHKSCNSLGLLTGPLHATNCMRAAGRPSA